MKKFGKLGIAGMLIATIAASSAITPAYAGKKERRVVAGIAIGAIAGAIIANQVSKKRERRHKRRQQIRNQHRYQQSSHGYQQPRVVYREPRQELQYEGRVSAAQAHVDWCHNRYRSYRTSDNTFQPYNGGRRQCFSPYN